MQRCEHTVEHAEAKTLIAELQAMQPGDDLYDAAGIVRQCTDGRAWNRHRARVRRNGAT